MDTAWFWLVVPGFLIWLGVGLVPWRPWSTREVLETHGPTPDEDFGEITVLVPARNEAGQIGDTLHNLRGQGRNLRIIVIDDESEDGTRRIAQDALADSQGEVLQGEPMPGGWTGKLWALEQGFQRVQTELTLLVDADIRLLPGILAALRGKLCGEALALVSLMARLRMETFWERLLMPAFVFFFKLLYPFALAADPRRRMAAAAGGCILVETGAIRAIGGFGALRGELIDDCALARRVKSTGGSIWLGLTHSVVSCRAYEGLGEIGRMVARTAYTQLRYSFWLLLLCSAILIAAYWLVPAGLLAPDPRVRGLALLAFGLMMLSYAPTLKFYGRSPAWSATLPLVGTLYLAMTWWSALRYWTGTRAQWRGRTYGTRERA